MFISPARSKLNSSTFEYTAETLKPSVDVVYNLAVKNIAACLTEGDFNSIH